MKKLFFLIAIIVIGCKNNNEIVEPKFDRGDDGVVMLITQNQLNYIGLDHNMFIDSHVHTDTVWDQTNYANMLNTWIDTCSNLNGIYTDLDSVTIHYLQSEAELENLIDTVDIDTVVKSYITSMRDIMGDTSLTLQETMDNLTSLENIIMNDVVSDSLEINIALSSIAVGRNSLYYWANNSTLTAGVYFKKTGGNKNKSWVKGVAKADQDGAIWGGVTFFGFGGAGVAMVGGPATFFGAFASAVITGAATASIQKALTGDN